MANVPMRNELVSQLMRSSGKRITDRFDGRCSSTGSTRLRVSSGMLLPMDHSNLRSFPTGVGEEPQTLRPELVGLDPLVSVHTFLQICAVCRGRFVLHGVKSAAFSDGVFHSITSCRLPN